MPRILELSGHIKSTENSVLLLFIYSDYLWGFLDFLKPFTNFLKPPFFLLKISTSPSTLDSETSPPVKPEKLLSGMVTMLLTAIIWFAAPYVKSFAPVTKTFFRNLPKAVIETSSTVLLISNSPRLGGIFSGTSAP